MIFLFKMNNHVVLYIVQVFRLPFLFWYMIDCIIMKNIRIKIKDIYHYLREKNLKQDKRTDSILINTFITIANNVFTTFLSWTIKFDIFNILNSCFICLQTFRFKLLLLTEPICFKFGIYTKLIFTTLCNYTLFCLRNT